jgi:hypothetical protein
LKKDSPGDVEHHGLPVEGIAVAPEGRFIMPQDRQGRQKQILVLSLACGAAEGRLRDEFLNTELFTTAPETQLLADRWR